MKQLVFLSVLLVLTCSASAVDGYKEFKFGMSVPEVQKLAKIPLSRSNEGNGLVTYQGERFPFGGKKVGIAFLFIDGKLVRIAFETPYNHALAILDSLREKYGAPSTPLDSQAMDAVNITPNTEAHIAFDDDTVIWRVMSDSSTRKIAMVIYSSPDFDRLLVEAQKKGLRDDL